MIYKARHLTGVRTVKDWSLLTPLTSELTEFEISQLKNTFLTSCYRMRETYLFLNTFFKCEKIIAMDLIL